MKLLIVYVPVLYAGYDKLFLQHRDVQKVLILGKKTLSRFDWLRKDLRSLDPERALLAVKSWNIFQEVCFFEDVPISVIMSASEIVMPDETECHLLAEELLQDAKQKITFVSVKLRYDKKKTEAVEGILATEVNNQEALDLMKIALVESKKTPDWWMSVGALVVRNGLILVMGHNQYRPTEREPLFMGDPRSNYGRGLNIELSLADHAEMVMSAAALREGISFLGADVYVTTFPCPPCGGLLAKSGIKRLFFQKGYAMLQSDSLLRNEGIELFRIVP